MLHVALKGAAMLLDGKVALVTGAGRGFGAGIARALARAGARVCVTDIDEAELAQSAAEIAADGGEATALRLDVSDLAAFEAAAGEVAARWGRLDVVVHNAIYMPLIRFEDTSPATWWRQIAVGLGGLYNAARAAWPTMKAQGGGHIMGIASGSSVRGYLDEVAYCTIKHGQEGFVKALALEAAPDKIAINTLGPGKPIKPTRITRAELAALPAEQRAAWADPAELGTGFVWLAAQPPERFSGLRFDAGTIADTVAAEGYAFAFAPEKVTRYVDDFLARQHWQANYEG
jgi:NAD(P)-dependent dehydrogenase (short-subunit alcohol dehydrogenase family)